jgi:hypothetical protein
MKSGKQTYFFLASYGFRSKVLVLVIVKKIQDPEKLLPDQDPGGKKATDHGSGSATLLQGCAKIKISAFLNILLPG